MFSQKCVNELICKLLDIDFVLYQDKVSKGMRPVKAAISLGANQGQAEAIAPLQIAISADDINIAYSQKNAMSCMSGLPVGAYYELNNIVCIWTPNFRVLYNPKSKTFLGSSYGTHRDIVMSLLVKHYKVCCSDFLTSEIVLEPIFRHAHEDVFTSYYTGDDYSHPLKRNIHISKIDENETDIPITLLSAPLHIQRAVHKIIEENNHNKYFDITANIDDYHINVWRISAKSIYHKPNPLSHTKMARRKIFQVLKDLPKEDTVNRNKPFADYTCNSTVIDLLAYNKSIDQLPYDVEEHYLKRLGESYRDNMPRSRTNYDRKYTRGKHVD